MTDSDPPSEPHDGVSADATESHTHTQPQAQPHIPQNRTSPLIFTRTRAVRVLRHRDASPATVLSAGDDDADARPVRAGRSGSRIPSSTRSPSTLVDRSLSRSRGPASKSRSRSVKPWGASRERERDRSRSLSKVRGGKTPGTAYATTSVDIERDAGVKQGDAAPREQAQRRRRWTFKKPKSPLEPLLRHIPMWLEGYIWGWIGGFVGVGLVLIIFTRATAFSDSTDVTTNAWTSPAIFGSFGAASVLLYGVPSSPLSQPRSFFFGQVVSTIAGVAVTKLFALSPHYDLSKTDHSYDLVWVAGAVATGTSITAMQILRVIHPPAAATALLCATSPQVERLGWRAIPVVMLSSAVMLAWTVLWMNAGRRSWPEWWFYPPESVRKTAFPGPELGPYVTKAKQRLMGRRATSRTDIEAISRSSNEKALQGTGGSTGGSAGSTAAAQSQMQQPTDAEWQDQTNWVRANDAEARGRQSLAVRGQGGEEGDRRMSRWDR